MSEFENSEMDITPHMSPAVTADLSEDRKRNRLDSPNPAARVSPMRSAGILDFGPTELEVIEEAEHSWIIENWQVSNFETPVFTVGDVEWIVRYSLNEMQSANGAFTMPAASVYLVPDPSNKFRSQNPSWAVCAELILGIENPNLEEARAAAIETAAKATPQPSIRSSLASPALSLFSSPSSSMKTAPSQTNAEPITVFSISKPAYHRFNAAEYDWGFSQFATVDQIKNGAHNFGPLCASDGSIKLIAKIRVIRDTTGVLWHNFNSYNSKQATGYVGLTNQGATCYMNSFLQSIFLTNAFRKAVYRIPTANCSPADSIPLALQRIFFKLQSYSSPPNTTELTKSFGWDTADSFMQHDVQEFSRVLLDDLENKMKGSEVEGTVERLFRGKLKNVLRCTEVDYESVREESFYDLQLTIKGVPNLQESFERYVAAEMLCGDNQYRTDSFGLQDAKKFVEFEHFPPVLHVHLERYAFDLMAEATVKIHDRFEFPTQIDLSPYLSENSPDRTTPQVYWLHSVLVHAGDGHGGHYFVYIRHPNAPNRWYKFDDTRVIPCSEREAVGDNFGGNDSHLTSAEADELYRSTGVRPSRYRKYTSAYLLVYIREADLGDILVPVEESDVPAYLIERIRADDEAEAKRRIERQNQYLTSNVVLVTDGLMASHRIGDIHDPEHPICEKRFSKDETLAGVRNFVIQSGFLTDDIEALEGVEMYQVNGRRNKTNRPDNLLLDLDSRTLATVQSRVSLSPTAFFLRAVKSDANEETDLWHVPVTAGKILIIVKWFSAEGELKPLGAVAVSPEATVSSILPSVAARLEIEAFETDLFYYEELKPTSITPIQCDATFASVKLRQGDIVIVTPVENGPIEYFSQLTSWKSFDIAPVEITGAKVCSQQRLDKARICTKWSLSELKKFIASELGLNEENLRVAFTVNGEGTKLHSSVVDLTASSISLDASGEAIPLKFLRSDNPGCVADFLQGTSPNDEIVIRYEVAPVPAVKAEGMMRLIVQEGHSLPTEVAALLPQVVYLPRYTATVSDLFTKLGLNGELRAYRLLECSDGRIRRTFTPGSPTELLSKVEFESSKTRLYLDAVNTELEAMPGSKLISCFTFERSSLRPYGVPFKFVLLDGETVKTMRARLSQRLGSDCINAALFICTGTRERRLEDEDEVLAGIPALDDADHIGVQLLDLRMQRSSSGFDGAIRFRRSE